MILAANRCLSRSPNTYIADDYSEIAGILNPRPGDVVLAIGAGFFDAWRLRETDVEPDGFNAIQSNACEYIWQRAGDYVNVGLFEAVPNTDEEQTEAFNRAVAAAPESSTLFVPPGTYILNALLIDKSVSIFLSSGAILKMRDQATDSMIRYTEFAEGGIFGPGVIDGNKDGQTQATWYPVIKTLTETRFFISHVFFRNCAYAAIKDTASTGMVEIAFCEFRNASEHGGVTTTKASMSLYMASAGMQLSVHHNRFVQDDYPSEAGRAPGGALIAGCTSVVVTDNYFFRVGQTFMLNHLAPIHVYELCNQVTICRNVIVEPLWDGIVFQNSSNLVCTENQISGVDGNDSLCARGIWFNPTQREQAEGPQTGIISNNIIRDLELAVGIFGFASSANAGRLTIAHNDISGSMLGGIRVSGIVDTPALFTAPLLIQGNNISVDDGQHGIRIEEVSGFVRVHNNDVRVTGNAHAFWATTGVELADFELSGNYFSADTSGFYAGIFRGMRRLFIRSGMFSNTGGGATAYTIDDDADGNDIQQLSINFEQITVLAGTSNITLADIVQWLGTVTLSVDPNNNIQAPIGTIYRRTSGGAGTTLYVKEGAAITGWVGK